MNNCNSPTEFGDDIILKKCRVCLTENGTSMIFSLYGKDKLNIREIFETYTTIKVNEEDEMPKSLCTDCLNSLVAVHKFITKCKTTDVILHTLETRWSLKIPSGYKVVFVEDLKGETEWDTHEISCTSLETIDVIDELSEIIDTKEFSNYPSELYVQSDCEIVDTKDNIKCIDENKGEISEQSLINDLQLSASTINLNNKHTEDALCSENEFDTNIFIKSELFSDGDLITAIDTITSNIDANEDDKSKFLTTDPIGNISCNICLKKCKSKSSLVEHMRVHTKEKPFKCDVCLEAFSARCTLIRHKVVHLDVKPYVCDICGKGVTQANTLKKHKEIMHNVNAGAKHLGDVKPILCSHCGVVCDRQGMFRKHLLKAHPDIALKGKEKALFTNHCTSCGRYFQSRTSLKRHMDCHMDVRNYLCSYCGKRFTTNGQLQTHLIIHTGERPYRCEFCGKSFNQPGALKSHIYIHTGTKPYQCEVCGKGFKMSGQLAYHLFTHTGEKRHSCTYCDKKFALKGNLRQHLASHSNERPYQCSYCTRTFKSSNNMKKHFKLHQKNQLD